MNYAIVRPFFLLIFMGLVCVGANAQESGSPSLEGYDKTHDPAYITGGADSMYFQARQQKRDSIASPRPMKRNVYKPSPVVPKQNNKDESNDESVLSFNFLYYLIQKYKMQDIVD